jgi:hypothetical protein
LIRLSLAHGQGQKSLQKAQFFAQALPKFMGRHWLENPHKVPDTQKRSAGSSSGLHVPISHRERIVGELGYPDREPGLGKCDLTRHHNFMVMPKIAPFGYPAGVKSSRPHFTLIATGHLWLLIGSLSVRLRCKHGYRNDRRCPE